MTTTTVTPSASGLSFGGILNSEWIKLRSLRSTFWCFGIIVVLTIGLGFLLASTVSLSADSTLDHASKQSIWVQSATLGISFSQLVSAVIGALIITGEYGTGMIRSTFTAVPRRLSAVAAKSLVFGVAMFALGLVSTVMTALLNSTALPGRGIQPDFGDGAVWLAFLGGAGYLALIGVMSFCIGAIIRNSAGSIASALGLILVLPIILGIFAQINPTVEWIRNLGLFLPNAAGARLYSYPTHLAAESNVFELTPLEGGLVLLAWIVLFGLIATVLVKRRDV